MRFIGTDINISVEEMLNSYMPKIYKDSKVVKEVNKVDAIELENIYSIVNNILDQTFVSTATWGLDLWEREYGITNSEDMTYEARRQYLYTKMNQKNSFSKDVAETLLRQLTNNPNAYIIELHDQYSFKTIYDVEDEIDFQVVRDAFKSLKPAHLYHIAGQTIREEISILDSINQKTKIKAKYVYKATDIGEADSVGSIFYLDGSSLLDGQRFLNGDSTFENNGFVNIRDSLTIKYKNNGQTQVEQL